MFEVKSAKYGNSCIRYLTYTSQQLYSTVTGCNERYTGMTSYGDILGAKLRLRATGIDGALTRLQRFSRSNLRNTVRAVPGFLLTEHSTPTVLSQFATTGTLGWPILQILGAKVATLCDLVTADVTRFFQSLKSFYSNRRIAIFDFFPYVWAAPTRYQREKFRENLTSSSRDNRG